MRKFYKSLTQILTGSLLTFAMISTAAATPDTLNYQGRLLDKTTGTPINGTVSMTFKIYIPGNPLVQWFNTREILVEDGIYQVLLGENVPFGALDFSQSLELGVTVGTDDEMSPRQPLASVPHAQKAFDADTLDSLDSSAFIQKGEISTISTDMIVDGAITAVDLGSGSVGSSQVADGSIKNSDLASASVNSANIIDNTITAADLAAGSVGASEIASNAVGTSEIADGTVTAADLVDDYVNVSGDSMTGSLAVENTSSTVTNGTSRIKSQAAFNTFGLLAITEAADDFEVTSADWYTYEIGAAGISVGTSTADNYGVIGHANNVGVRGEYSLSPTANYGELGKNGVGVFGKGTTWAGEFNGAVKANSLEITGEYRYTAAQTHYYHISPAEFADSGAAGGNDYCFSTTSGGSLCDGSWFVYTHAGIHLPKGAVITAVRAYFYDNNPNAGFYYFNAGLSRKLPTDTTTPETIASISTSTSAADAASNVRYITDTILEYTTVSDAYQYIAYASLRNDNYLTANNDNLNFRGLRITYTMDTVAP